MSDSRAVTQLRERVFWTPLQYQVNQMDPKQAMEIFDLGNEVERVELTPVLMQKIQRAFEGGRLDPEKTGQYVRLVHVYFMSCSGGARRDNTLLWKEPCGGAGAPLVFG